jgi:hypothetical protein
MEPKISRKHRISRLCKAVSGSKGGEKMEKGKENAKELSREFHFLSNGDFLFLSNDETLFNPYVDFETKYLRGRVFERQGESFFLREREMKRETDERKVTSAWFAYVRICVYMRICVCCEAAAMCVCCQPGNAHSWIRHKNGAAQPPVFVLLKMFGLPVNLIQSCVVSFFLTNRSLNSNIVLPT